MQIDFKYADLLNDEVFKLVFGQESSKDVMIEFLNQVIVELQRRKQDSYAERMLYYSMHQILKQVESGESSFDFCPVYVISILNFTLEQNAGIPDVRTVYRLYEERYNRPLTDRVTYIFLELPKFTKDEDQLDGNVLDGMYFCLRNMTLMVEKPKALSHNVFDKIFSIAELYNMDEETRLRILESMTTERDLKNQFAYVRKEGFAMGRAEERRANAAKLKALGVDVAIISQATGLSVQDISLL